MKTIVAIWNAGNRGKSQTLREFAIFLLINYPGHREIYPIPKSVPLTGDFRLVVDINGIIVGIESQGDPGTGLEKRLFELADKFKCDLILCSTRTKGETVYAVENLESTKGFQIIWTSTYQIVDENQQNIVNQIKAKHILDLLKNLKLL
jgi:hypothetical protein